MDLMSFVVQPTWKEFLIELVNSNQMNPWEVDLIDVADKYLQKIRELQSMDLRIPANIILASALLLRFKADALSLEEEEPEPEVVEEHTYIQEEIPELVLRANQPRRRKLTLEELIQAVDDVMRDQAKPILQPVAPKIFSIELQKEDMNELMQKVYERALEIKDTQNVLLFSELIKPYFTGEPCPGPGNGHSHGIWCYGVENVVRHLMPILHLVQENKVLAWQDNLFGEIFVRVLDEKALQELERRAKEAVEKDEKEETELQAKILARRQRQAQQVQAA
ncbi:segregation/condensation protein A [Candidatus Micrarchaeota archaeon]|nr:segregation/condensation protein A [Candidatus Micrarchaeota archaeon]